MALLLLSPVSLAGAAPEEDETEQPARPAQPDEWREKITVTAELEGARKGPLGSSSSVLNPASVLDHASSLTSLVATVPGVSQNGQGGQFQNVSIRGVSRQRVTHQISSVRVSSDRRAGPSTSFIDPRLMGSVEVLRGPSTTFHGAGALGGVVQVLPKRFDRWVAEVGYSSVGNENHLAFGNGGDGWSAGFARRDATNAEAADGTALNSQFTQYSAALQFDWQRGEQRYALIAVPAYGDDIGKSNTDFPDRVTRYPRERHLLIEFSVGSERIGRLQAYVHPYDLETEVREQDQRSTLSNDSFDFGLRWDSERELAGDKSVRFGADVFSRDDVDAEERTELTGQRSPTPRQTLDGASELEAGAFSSVRWSWGKTSLESGVRLSWQGQKNADTPSIDRTAGNGFAGLSRELGQRWELSAGLSSGLRFPSLSELFFSGTTGRGSVVGNPDLDPERSFNGEVSLRWIGKRLLINGGVFANRIEDYIERIELVSDVLTFVNLTSGTIRGIELQGLYSVSPNWLVTAGGHVLEGRSGDDAPLADIAPDEFYLETDHRTGNWSYKARLSHRSAKNDPGGGEKRVPSAALLHASVRYGLSKAWAVSLSGDNLLDEDYFLSADRKAAQAAGRSVSLRLLWNDD